MPFQKQVTAAEVIVTPRSYLCPIQSVVAAPSAMHPAQLVGHARVKRIRLAVVVLPASMWAEIPILR